MNTTFIIQGPLTSDTLRSVKICGKHGKVIVSCWNTDDPLLLQKVHDFNYCKVIINTLIKGKNYNFQNLSFQLESTVSALEICDTEFAVKIRSDEYFTRLYPIIKSVEDNPDKISCCNFLFRKKFLFHPSDHMFGGTVENMSRMTKEAYGICKSKEKNKKLRSSIFNLREDYAPPALPAEMLLCLSWLKVNDDDIASKSNTLTMQGFIKQYRELMKKRYALVRLSDLGHFLVRFKTNNNINGPTAFTCEKQVLDFEVESIASLDELDSASLKFPIAVSY